MENNGQTFTIDTMLGDIYTAVFLDREQEPRYSFKVFAYDKSDQPLTAVTMVTVNVQDVNDEVPRFKNQSYHFRVDERTPPGSLLGQVRLINPTHRLDFFFQIFLIFSHLS